MSSFSPSYTLKFLDAFKSEVRIHYLLYDELPLLAKWVEVQGEGLDIGIDYVEVWSTSLSDNIHTGSWRLVRLSNDSSSLGVGCRGRMGSLRTTAGLEVARASKMYFINI